MVIVTLEDGTTYNIDSDSDFNARSVVEYKLRQRMDYRKIKNTQEIKGAICDSKSKYYNSGRYDSTDLKCTSGWDYRWN